MKLINFNTCIQIDNSKEVAKLLKSFDPDIITLQEVSNPKDKNVVKQYRSRETIERYLGEEWKYSCFAPLWYGKDIKEGDKLIHSFGGTIEQGNEIISKYPIVNASNNFFHKSYEHVEDWSKWGTEDHARAVIVSEIQIGDKILQVLNIHGIWTKDKLGDERTIKECKYIVNTALKKKLPTIITGDFNLYPETESIQIVNKSFRNLIEEYGIKTTRPDFKNKQNVKSNVADYIFVSDLINVVDFKIIDIDISDHLPLYLEFNIK